MDRKNFFRFLFNFYYLVVGDLHHPVNGDMEDMVMEDMNHIIEEDGVVMAIMVMESKKFSTNFRIDFYFLYSNIYFLCILYTTFLK
jgi:hypothetical protein